MKIYGLLRFGLLIIFNFLITFARDGLKPLISSGHTLENYSWVILETVFVRPKCVSENLPETSQGGPKTMPK